MAQRSMTQMPSQGGYGGVGNARMGMAGGNANVMTCHFPAPPPRRVYCHPAAFSRNCGDGKYQRLVSAYGSSRPAMPSDGM